MQLLLRRSIREPMGRVRFVLWAKFEVSSEDARLLSRYRAAAGYLTIEQSRRDFFRAVIIAFFIAFVATAAMLSARAPVLVVSMVFVFSFIGATWFIYDLIREAIKIGDILEGREFKHKSLVLMARRERRMIGYAHAFAHFLEKLKEWEGTEIIEIGEDDHERALRLVTDTYAPA